MFSLQSLTPPKHCTVTLRQRSCARLECSACRSAGCVTELLTVQTDQMNLHLALQQHGLVSTIKTTTYSRYQIRCIFLTSLVLISSPNPMFNHLLESSHRDDSYKWSNIGFDEENRVVESIDVNFMHLIWSNAYYRFTTKKTAEF